MYTRVELPDEVKQNMERGENFAILWNGLLVVASSFFLPAVAFFILLAIYCVAVAVYSVYREEIKKSLFNFFDKVVSFFGVPTVEEVIEAERRIQAPQQQQGMDYAAIHLLFANDNPMFLAGGNQHPGAFVLDEETTGDEQEEPQNLQSVQQQENAIQQNILEEGLSLQGTLDYKNIQKLAYLAM